MIAVRIRPIGGDNVEDEFAPAVIDFENVRGQTLTVVKREDGDRVVVGLVQPLRASYIRHRSGQHSKKLEPQNSNKDVTQLLYRVILKKILVEERGP
jgi:hypothetical protein